MIRQVQYRRLSHYITGTVVGGQVNQGQNTRRKHWKKKAIIGII